MVVIYSGEKVFFFFFFFFFFFGGVPPYALTEGRIPYAVKS